MSSPPDSKKIKLELGSVEIHDKAANDSPNSTSMPSASNSQESSSRSEIVAGSHLTLTEVEKGGRANCEYGVNCYRKNPHHFHEFKHSQLETLYTRIMTDKGSIEKHGNYEESKHFTNKENLVQQLKILEEMKFKENANASSSNSTTNNQNSKINDPKVGDMLSKWTKSLPYNLFLTKLSVENDANNVVRFRDIFHHSMGKVESICHFNFMVEFEWFLDETLAADLEGKKITIIYGVQTPELVSANAAFPWITTYLIKSPFPYGHHHTKMSLIKFEGGSLRFVVYTANLIESDWDKRTQGIWIGPKCPQISEASNITGESQTNFRSDIIQYLSTYPSKHVGSWITAIRNSDCSDIKVAFVASAPVTLATSTNGFQWGHKKLEKVLKSFPNPKIQAYWPLIMQCSSIGTLGGNEDWFRNEIGANMCPTIGGLSMNSLKFPMHVIFPTFENVLKSYDGIRGGGCLPYSVNTHQKQDWLGKYFYKWKSDLFGRSRAVPHIKSYCRISPDFSTLGWFLLTSANLSKAAWGKLNKVQNKLSVMSWEAGVLFIPKNFGNFDTFEVAKTRDSFSASRDANSSIPFSLPFDVPVVKYEKDDRPWFIERLLAEQTADSGDD